MQRILGFYSFKKPYPAVYSEIPKLFKTDDQHVHYVEFRQGSLSVCFEMLRTEYAKNYFFFDKKNKIACFVVGHVFAYRESSLGELSGASLARVLIDKYKKDKLAFVKHLRGVFNIIIIDKNEVFLINDKLGLSPLYLYKINTGFFFATQAESIIWANKNSKIDSVAVAEFVSYGFPLNGKTFIKGLSNQSPGTVTVLRENKIVENRYFSFSLIDIKGMSPSETIVCAKDLFMEAVRIRVGKEPVFCELSGGWDTRFILANLLELGKKNIYLFTNDDGVEQNAVIAKKISKKFHLKHIVCDNFRRTEFQKRSGKDFFFFTPNCSMTGDNYRASCNFGKGALDVGDIGFCSTPRFTGLFGTLFGFVPLSFIERFKTGMKKIIEKAFTEQFLAMVYEDFSEKEQKATFSFSKKVDAQHNYPYLYLMGMGRSYLCSHGFPDCLRPTRFFKYLHLVPFADLSFLRLVCSVDYDKNMYYKLYYQVYKKYYPEFLKIPWTYQSYRPRFDCPHIRSRSKYAKQYPPDKTMAKEMVTDREIFFRFLLRSKIFKKTYFTFFSRSQEAYFFYKWLDAHKDVLGKSERDFFGDFS